MSDKAFYPHLKLPLLIMSCCCEGAKQFKKHIAEAELGELRIPGSSQETEYCASAG